MFNKFEALRSLRGVTHWLNDMGYKTKRGTTWAASTVRRRLSDITNLGYHTYGKRAGNSKIYLPEKDWLIKKGDFKPIISKNQFDRVQAISQQKNFRAPQRRCGVTYLLSSLMRCECGGSMTGYTHVKKNNKRYAYYRCHNHVSKGNGICPGNSLAKEQIEGRILKYIRSKADIHFEEAEIEKVILKNDTDSPREKLLNMENNIKQIKKKQERVLEFIEDGSMPKEVIKSQSDGGQNCDSGKDKKSKWESSEFAR
jgi:site-specific DNA recombinase